MKKLFIVFMTVFFCYQIKAQTDTLYVDELGSIQPKEKASYFRILSSIDSNDVEIKEYYLNQKIHCIGHYTSEQAVIKEGKFTYYNADGFKASEGEYKKGFKTGEWVYYFDEGKKIRERQLFFYPAKGYYLTEYDMESMTKVREGKIDEFEKKSGIWKEYHLNSDSVKLISNYQVGQRKGEQLEYYKNGKLKRKEYLEGYKALHGELYDEIGKKIKYYPAFVYPVSPEPVWKYLSVRLKSFDVLIKKTDIHYTLKVNKDGTISEIEILNVNDVLFKDELLKAMHKMKKWKPAKYENKAINYTVDNYVRYHTRRD